MYKMTTLVINKFSLLHTDNNVILKIIIVVSHMDVNVGNFLKKK